MICQGCRNGFEEIRIIGYAGDVIRIFCIHNCEWPSTCPCQHKLDAQYLREVKDEGLPRE